MDPIVKVGRVVGTVVSTIQHEAFDGRRLLLVDTLDAAGEPDGGYLICVDAVGAGAGEAVLVIDEGNSARQVIGMDPAPVRAVVVGIVDWMTVDGDQPIAEA
ncbi:MAG: EutN/CcmL family microcompartment protein [Actinobacteria bacterium]|nr:EutN/CcmL family microcompartment protein [Actinomycetota bacterium]